MIKDNTNKSKIGIKIALFWYVVFLHILFVIYYKDIFVYNYNGLLFIYNFNPLKYLLCIVETVIMCYVTQRKVDRTSMSDTVMLLLNMLYFVPGVVQQAVTDMPWGYMVFYFVFWAFMELWLVIIKPRKKSFFGGLFHIKRQNVYWTLLALLAIGIIGFMFIYTGNDLSFSTLKATFNDVYGVRAASKAQNVHWIILNFLSWAAYFSTLAIAYFAEQKKWIRVVALFVGIFALFIVQANRITVFLAGCALLVSVLKLNNRKFVYCLLLIGVALAFEAVLLHKEGIITDIFRRFSIVPNRLSEQYFDYFADRVPDLLRSKYPRIINLLGIESPYYSPSIATMVGHEYYGSDVNANTGLVGGSMSQFGYASAVISTLGYVLGFRMFEGVTYRVKSKSVVTAFAVILVSLVINMYSLLANIFSLTYFLLLYVTLIPISGGGGEELTEDSLNG